MQTDGTPLRFTRWSIPIASVFAAPTWAFACSGDDAMERIRDNERLGWILWAVTLSIAIVFAALRQRRMRNWRAQWPLLALVVVHPGWWLSARSGDCGAALSEASIAMTAVAFVVVAALYLKAR